MNDNAKSWVAALRSGEYKQTGRVLHRREQINDETTDSFCCLGVACDLAAKAGVITPGEVNSSFSTIVLYEDVDTVLPFQVQEWLGLTSNRGDYMRNETHTALTSDNDNGKSFLEIADIIEAEQNQLFVQS